MSNPELTPADLKRHVEALAAQDDAFRASLLADPRAAVERLLGVALPAQIRLQAIEEAPDTYVIAVPAKLAAAADGELSDDDLEAVAGGSKAGAKKFFNNVGSGTGLLAFAPVAIPSLSVPEVGEKFVNTTGDKILKSCGMI